MGQLKYAKSQTEEIHVIILLCCGDDVPFFIIIYTRIIIFFLSTWTLTIPSRKTARVVCVEIFQLQTL